MAPQAFVDARGRKAEDAACRYLQERGFRIVERNVSSRWGEIDVVARDGDTWVFIEVKGRADENHGSGFEAVTALKRRKITRAAEAYAARRGFSEGAIRFDVVSVTWGAGPRPVIAHVRSAFDADGR